LRAGDRVVGDHLGTAVKQAPDHVDRGRLAQVVGVRFEGEAEHADALALEVPQGVAHLLHDVAARLQVDLGDLPQDAEVHPQLP
jgi:hypothetical protein